MTPMFVETQSSQSPESSTASQSGAMKGMLRATQTSLEFSQTQTAGSTETHYPGIKAENLQVNTSMFTFTCFFPQVDVRLITG